MGSARARKRKRVKKTEQVNWEEFGEEIVYKVGRALDRWCWEVSGDDALSCYSAHADRSLYELAEEFAGWYGITERDLELLREMPESVYKKYEAKLQREIERVVRELRKEAEELAREVCRDECGNDEACITECVHEKVYGW